MKRYTSILFLALFCLASAISQNVEFKSSNFRDDKDGLKKAEENIELGDDFMEAGLPALAGDEEHHYNFSRALERYLMANEFNPDNAELNYKIGKCLLYTPDKTGAIPYLEKAIQLDPELNAEVYFLLGRAMKYDYRFEEATGYLKKARTLLSNREADEYLPKIKKELEECKNADLLITNPARVWIDPLSDINTAFSEYCASVTADESMLLFNVRNSESTGGLKNDNNEYHSDIYASYREGKNWSDPVKLSPKLNSSGDDDCVAVSPDGQSLFMVRNMNGNDDLYISRLAGSSWTTPYPLARHRINTEYNETHASFSHDNIRIWFATDNPYANKGGTDLFFSGRINTRHEEEWGKAATVGTEVNTNENEGCIFIHPDGKTLFFSSKGHNSMGGYDLFKCTRLPGRWSEPENLGYPVNTPYDEKYISVSASGKHAYITSNRKQDNKGGYDLYRITFLGPVKPMIIERDDRLISSIDQSMQQVSLEAPVVIEGNHLTVLRGRVLDEFTREPVEASIEIVDNELNQVISTFHSNSETGKFLVSLPAGVNYGIAIDAEDYLFYSENFDLPELSSYQLVTKDIYLQNICIGCKIVLRNVFFDTGKYILRPESTPELERLHKLLKEITRLKVEISGHTDNVGSDDLNQKLSENRAKAVVTWLVDRGIEPGRITYKGYGPSEPIATNDTPGGRQQNRRTEFKIIEN